MAKGHGNRIERASNRPFKKTCADAEIDDARTCEFHILALQAEARAAVDATARPAEDEAEAAAQAANKDDVRPAAEPWEDAATETPAGSRRALAAKDCLVDIVGSDGTIRCVEALTPEGIAALAAGTEGQTGTQVDVTTETVTENTRRASSEEFRKQDRDDRKDRDG